MANTMKLEKAVKPSTMVANFPELITRLVSAVVNTNEYKERIRLEAVNTYGLAEGLYDPGATQLLNVLQEVEQEGDSGFLGTACILVQHLEGYNEQLRDIADAMRNKTGYFEKDQEIDEPKVFKKGKVGHD